MSHFQIRESWQLPERSATAEGAYWNRRQIVKALVTTGFLPLIGCTQLNNKTGGAGNVDAGPLSGSYIQDLGAFTRNPAFLKVDRPVTDRLVAASYNNFYEFGGNKGIWPAAQSLPVDPWKMEVTGLVKNPKTYDLDDLKKVFPLEERIYRFRCVEAWSMVLPWLGFPMRSLIAAVEPTSNAKFVRFTSYYDPKVTKGPGLASLVHSLPWPYTEGLRIEEMANELAFFAVGIYGQSLPKQHGAPIRAVLPWKYGFKGAKSIVKIEFLEQQPATYWNTLDANEYDFEANVNPQKPHPRWSQATERFIGDEPQMSWTRIETLPYNGYGEYVANLYRT